MDNYAIADNFSLLAKLMDIHGDNSFKAKSYSSAAFTIEKLPAQLDAIPQEKIFSIKGVGEAIGNKIIEQLTTGRLSLLDEYLAKTPPGILELLSIKGIGPKKIAVIWKELEIETPGELLYACNENRLTLYKGFGEKSQQNIKEAIEFFLSAQGSYLYAQVETFATEATKLLQQAIAPKRIELVGDINRRLEVIDKAEWVTTADADSIINYFTPHGYTIIGKDPTTTRLKGKENIELVFYHTSADDFAATQFRKNCSPEFYTAWTQRFQVAQNAVDEAAIFSDAGAAVVPAFLRESTVVIEQALQHRLPVVIQPEDITAIIHSHSTWSDGVHSIETMARAAMDRGLQFMVISDHSRSAFYANGLQEERIIAQHQEIDALNRQLAPFRIFKSIESDILNDGSLDYDNAMLSRFDLVIASVHSNLKMTEEKAMMRLLRAIENPYTSILGHMTGRLLLSRNGYPVDHKTIIEACAAHNVVIELNAHPKRLDIDWRWIRYCLEKNVRISINPDAHSIEGYDDVRYGVMAAQKAGVTKADNLSSCSLAAFEAFLQEQHAKRP